MSLEDAAWLDWLPEKVFIIGNKACFLGFPKVTNAVAVFGEGFKSRLASDLPWMDKTDLYCWFDMDAAGFEMLNMIRSHHREAKSLLMDQETYKCFEEFSVENRYPKRNFHSYFPVKTNFIILWYSINVGWSRKEFHNNTFWRN